MAQLHGGMDEKKFLVLSSLRDETGAFFLLRYRYRDR